MTKVSAPRSNKEAEDLFFKVMGKPQNTDQVPKTKKELEEDRQLVGDNTYNVR